MAKRKKKGVPEVLWRLFGDRARTLADTILALSVAGGDEATSFLVRSTDDLDYRNFLSETFVVVSDDAPPPPVFDHRCRWSQLQIVRRTIEIIMSESRQASSNLICCSYDKESQSSPTVDELTSAKWIVLLSRVGDALQYFFLFLRRSTIRFVVVPLPNCSPTSQEACLSLELSTIHQGMRLRGKGLEDLYEVHEQANQKEGVFFQWCWRNMSSELKY